MKDADFYLKKPSYSKILLFSPHIILLSFKTKIMKKLFFIFFALMLITVQTHGQFTSNPDENTQLSDLTGEQAIPKIANCTDGSMYVSWFSNENGNYNMRMQYLDANGNAQWEPNGMLISDHEQMSWLTGYSLTVDPENHAVVTFQDIRAVDNNPVAYRVSPAGEMIWGDDGILLSNNSNFEPDPQVCATETGNLIFAWQSIADESEVHLQKISPTGDLLWGSGISLAESGIEYTAPFLQPADGDYAFLIWHKETGPFWASNRGLYVQKLDTDGSFMWADAAEIYAPTPAGAVVSLEMCRDNDGGIIFSWYGNDVGTHFNCWVQFMEPNGNLTMAANGEVVSTSQSQNHMYPTPSFLTETEEIIVFFSEQDLNQNQRGLYAQKFDLQGNRQWTDNGKTLIPLSNNDYSLPAANGYFNKAICIYEAFDFGNSVDSKVQAVMVDTDGNFVWNDEFIDLSTVQSAKLHRDMSTINMGQWVVVWGDERNGNRDIYAQNIFPDGSLGIGSAGEGKILGFVRDAVTNYSIDQATITATNTDDDYQTVYTPFGSHYSFEVSEGNYNLTCEAAGYETFEVNDVVVVADMNTPVNFYLTPVDMLTGIEQQDSEHILVYPNPFSSRLNISIPTEESVFAIEVKDIKGQVIKKENYNGNSISGLFSLNLSELNSGIYFYNIQTSKDNYSGKITKN